MLCDMSNCASALASSLEDALAGLDALVDDLAAEARLVVVIGTACADHLGQQLAVFLQDDEAAIGLAEYLKQLIDDLRQQARRS